MIKVDFNCSNRYIDEGLSAFDILEKRNGKGNDFLGWMDLPNDTPPSLFADCEAVASLWRKIGVDVVVIIGIGGSYLGARAAIDALSHSFIPKEGVPKIVFAGNNLSEEYHSELMEFIADKSVATIVISKSGTTTEPAVAFRVIKALIEEKYGKQGSKLRIIAVTDSSKGALRTLANSEGYKTFVIDDNIGGRFSVLSPVGLLPIAIAGYDIRKMVEGALRMSEICSVRSWENPAIQYAAARNSLYKEGKKIEILVSYNPKLQYIGEWWKQLFGESEGKEGLGIFPASVNFTTDLHSMGQYIQDGERILFETVLSVANSNRSLSIINDPDNLDGLNFLSGKHFEECNNMAELGTKLSHIDGGVPNLRIEIERIDEFNLGELFFFFEISCAISAYILGVNPFDQPGVEGYKKNMFALLGKPGYKEIADQLFKRL